MNYTEKLLSEWIEENGGTVLLVSPFEFRGSAFTVGFIEYFGYDCRSLDNSTYEIVDIAGSVISSSSFLTNNLCLREDDSIALREDDGLEMRE